MNNAKLPIILTLAVPICAATPGLVLFLNLALKQAL